MDSLENIDVDFITETFTSLPNQLVDNSTTQSIEDEVPLMLNSIASSEVEEDTNTVLFVDFPSTQLEGEAK